MYIYYVNNNDFENISEENEKDFRLQPQYTIRVVRPIPKDKITILWYIFNFCTPIKFLEYQIVNSEGKIVSFAQVVGKIYRYPFMTPRAIHIGPCETVEGERGKGFYPYLLTHILQDFRGTQAFMIVKDSNIASIRGLSKAGFKPFAKGHKNLIRQFIVNEYI